MVFAHGTFLRAALAEHIFVKIGTHDKWLSSEAWMSLLRKQYDFKNGVGIDLGKLTKLFVRLRTKGAPVVAKGKSPISVLHWLS